MVWRATWRDTPVAVKKFDEESIAFSEDEFQSEVALMSILRHENIVHCMGSCMEPCNLFIVLELFEKGNLEGIIYDKAIPLPIQLVVHLALGAAKGMLYLHTLGIFISFFSYYFFCIFFTFFCFLTLFILFIYLFNIILFNFLL